MRFPFFGKKRSESNEALQKIEQISSNLKNSFIRIKSDIKVIRDWLSFFKTKDEDYSQKFQNIESRLDEMGEVLTYLTEKDQFREETTKKPKKTVEALYYDNDDSQKTPLDHLTETQNAIFFRLGAFQRESGQEWTPLKALAQDIYPGKSYDKVRSTISEYIGVLIDAGLIRKTRKGKRTYIGITQKGQEYLQNPPKTPKKAVQKEK